MSQKVMTQTERQELWQWLQQSPAPMAPAPGWVVKSLDEPAAFLKYAQADLDLRVRVLELEMAKLKAMKELIGSLPGPLP
jgi:hypothetical protein